MKHIFRKAILCMASLLIISSVCAQDIIVTTDARKIEAKILEVSLTEIKYKEMDNLDGPTFILGTNNINSIIYANGKVVVYVQTPVETPVPENANQAANDLPAQNQSALLGRIYRDNGEYMYNGTFISSKEVARLLEKADKAAYTKWSSAQGMEVVGGIFASIGCGLVAGSIYPFITKSYGLALGLSCGGLASEVIALGLLIGARSSYSKAIDLYNSKYDHAAVQLKWHIAPTELGLAFAF